MYVYTWHNFLKHSKNRRVLQQDIFKLYDRRGSDWGLKKEMRLERCQNYNGGV